MFQEKKKDNSKKKYLIVNECLESETYTEMTLTEEELKTILKFCNKNNDNVEWESCQTGISVYKKYKKILGGDVYEYNEEDALTR